MSMRDDGPSAACPSSSPVPAAVAPMDKHLYDLPNEILLKILASLPCHGLLPLGLTSTRLHDLARRVLRGHLLATVGRTDLRIILESYHPWAQWTEPYLYCTYLDTPGLGLEDWILSSSPPQQPTLSTAGSPLCDDNNHNGRVSSPPLDLVCPDANAPPLCSASSLAALLRNVYSRFRPLVPGAMTVTDTRHPAGGRMPVRKGNIARAASIAVPGASQPTGSHGLSASAPTTSSASAFPSSSSSNPDPTGAHLAALHNASMLTDRLRTTNPTIGPDNHAITNGLMMMRQQAEVEARAQATASHARAAGTTREPAAEDEAGAAEQPDAEPPLVSHRIRMDADEPFSQLVVQTSLIGEGPRPGVFGRLLPVNNQGVVRVKREWLEERAANDEQREDPQERIRRTLWVDHGRDVGLCLRVITRPDDRDIGPGEVCFEVLYEELLIRTAHLEAVIDRARRGEVSGNANRGVVFGTFLDRGWVRG